MQPPAFELIGLSKSFGGTVAVDDVSLAVPQSSFYGLVGPNGAGKTTALSMGVGLLRPDGGTSRVLGADVWAEPLTAKAMLGVLPDGLMMPERLTGRELLTYMGLLRSIPAKEVAARSAELLDVLDLASAEETLVIEYSAGMRKKIGLAAAMLHGPKLLVLDEPFEGVDPVSASTIRTILERYVRAGSTVIFSSHVMALVEALCSHVALIADGRVRSEGTLEDVRDGRSLETAFMDLVGAEVGGEEGLAWLAS